MSDEKYHDTPTRRLFEKEFEFWIQRKFIIDRFTDEVIGIYSSGVPEIDEMHLKEEVPIRLNIPDAAMKTARGIPLTISDPNKNAILIFNMLLAHAEYTKQNLANEPNAPLPDLENSRILESFMGQVWRIARGRLKDPSQLSELQQRLGSLRIARRSIIAKKRDVPAASDQMKVIRHSEFKGTQIEEIIARRRAERGED